MSVMYIRNEQTGEFEPVPSLVGPQGPPGANGGGAGTVTSVNNVAPDATGNVTLTAANVGALSSGGTAVNANELNGKSADQYALKTDLPTKASDVGALPSDGTAADSSKLGGVAASSYALKTDTAPNSTKLNGEAASYYATASALSSLTNRVSALEAIPNANGVSY